MGEGGTQLSVNGQSENSAHSWILREQTYQRYRATMPAREKQFHSAKSSFILYIAGCEEYILPVSPTTIVESGPSCESQYLPTMPNSPQLAFPPMTWNIECMCSGSQHRFVRQLPKTMFTAFFLPQSSPYFNCFYQTYYWSQCVHTGRGQSLTQSRPC